MSRGGHRPGAGRPKGSKDKMPRRPSAPPPVDEVAELAFLSACSAFVASGEPFKVLREFMESGDPSRRAWAVSQLLSYGVGLPGRRAEVVPNEIDLGEIVQQMNLRHRDQEAEVEEMVQARLEKRLRELGLDPKNPPRLPPAPEPLNRAPAASGEPVEPDVLVSEALVRRPPAKAVSATETPWPEVTRALTLIELVRK